MRKKVLGVLGIVVPAVVLIGVVALMVIASQGASMPMIDTRGVIADAQRDTLYLVVGIMLIVVIPVFIILFFVALRYRESNTKAKYTPNWASSHRLETIWWGIPIAIVAVLSFVAWQTSHSLDPYRPIESDKPTLQVSVIALQWRWLFIYPEQGVASLGELAMPVDRPVAFTITSDAPMNSFWIPQLGGQIYAMSGMSTKLHLEANEPGDYRGVSANLSGEGHKSMTFTARAMDETELKAWFDKAARSESLLDKNVYEELRKPTTDNPVTYFQLRDNALYDSVLSRYSHAHMTGGEE